MNAMKKIGVMVVCVAIVVSASLVFAERPGPRGDRALELFRQLRLTNEQATQLRAIMESQKPAIDDSHEAVIAADMKLQTFLKSGGSDGTELQTLSAGIGSAVAAEKLKEANVFVGAYGILNGEQRQELAALTLPLAERPVPDEPSRSGHTGAFPGIPR